MNGARALFSVKMISALRSPRIIRMGASHHFFRTFMKAHSSPMRECLTGEVFSAIESRLLIQRELPLPVDVVGEPGLVLLVEDEMVHHAEVHLRAYAAEIGVVGRADARFAA